ncbi:MAG: GatB/YqeY domain-containing protein [Pseudomonadota bacterium]
MLRERITKATKEAMKAKEARRLSTLRLISAAIKDREIALRADEGSDGLKDADIIAILSKMIKQRRDSVSAYEEGGRLELAEQERSEIKVIEEFLPKKLSDAEVEKAIAGAIEEVRADSVRDMGKVMGILKTKYSGQMDFGSVGAAVKAQLS